MIRREGPSNNRWPRALKRDGPESVRENLQKEERGAIAGWGWPGRAK